MNVYRKVVTFGDINGEVYTRKNGKQGKEGCNNNMSGAAARTLMEKNNKI